MIWQADAQRSTPQAEIASKILEAIPAVCGNPALAANPRLVAVAEGVAAYLADTAGGRDVAADGRTLELMRRALEANGEAGLARRIVVCGSTLVHPATWLTANGETFWIMDLARLLDTGKPGLELALFERARSVLDSFADVWDATSGKGVLGLKNLVGSARRVLGVEADAQRTRRLGEELHAFCADRMARHHHVRQWTETPIVLGLHG